MKKRILSCLMALALCLTLLPTAALAEEPEGTAQTSPAVEEAADPANGKAKQENQPAEQEEQQEDSATKQDEAVAAVQAMIDALPDAAELDGMDDADAMAVYEAFQAACDAYYDTLTEGQQAQLKNTEKLAALSDWFSQPETLATGEHRNHCLCGTTHNSNITTHKAGDLTTFATKLYNTSGDSDWYTQGPKDFNGKPLNRENNKWVLPTGCYYLVDDSTSTGLTDYTIKIDGEVTICLNGKQIKKIGNTTGSVFEVPNGSKLTLTDCKGKGQIVCDDKSNGSGVYVNGGTLNLYSGQIANSQGQKGTDSNKYGGGVYVESGTFNMYGGTITQNSADYGGGVYVNNGTFNMDGGTIENNTSGGVGGAGVYVEASGNFIMNNTASVTANKMGYGSTGGAGVYVNGGTFEMNGNASVTGNKATYGPLNGGGVYVKSGTFTMNGSSKVTGNKATYATLNGGGVYVKSGTFTMNGDSKVTGNAASGNNGGKADGGGVYVEGGKFEMNGEETSVSNNTATGFGGGVYMENGTFTVSGAAVIKDNKKGTANNNVYLPDNKHITIGGALADGASIGVTTKSEPAAGGSLIVIGKNLTAGAAEKFISDKSGYAVSVNENKDGLVLVKAHAHFLCGGNSCTKVGHTQETSMVTFKPWDKTNELPTTAGNYYLTDNVTLSSSWKPVDGTVLCLNGHSITADGNGDIPAILVYSGSITLCDCKGDDGAYGKITHPVGKNGSGVYVRGTFNMYGGSITNNTADNGGGVYMGGENSKFNMYGGEISGNTATVSGGGVSVSGGKFTMSGGRITGNNGSGVFVNDNTKFIVSGAPTVTGNTRNRDIDSNVYLTGGTDTTITIGGALTDGASIGVTKGAGSAGSVIATGATEDYSGKFSSDNTRYVVKHDAANNQLVLAVPSAVTHTHSWTYTVNGATIKATCTGEGVCDVNKDGGSVTIKAPTNTTYDGNEKLATLEKSTKWQSVYSKDITITYCRYVDGNYSDMYGVPTEVGKYMAKITVDGKTASVVYEITNGSTPAEKTDPKYTPPTAKTGLVYNGTAQVLINKGSVEGGIMQYRLDNGTYSPDLPTATNAGTYTVWYKVVGDDSHNNVAEKSLKVWIEKAPLSSGGSSSGGGGGSSSPSNHPVKAEVSKDPDGSVSLSKTSAAKGDKVTITVKPERHYEVDKVIVRDSKGKQLAVKDNGDGTFTFEMPADKVTVEPSFSWVNPFADVADSAYYVDAVEWMLKREVTQGTTETTFSPDLNCTRAQIVTFLWRVAGSPEAKGTVSFADVSADSYYAKAVAWATENGITDGIGGGLFSPDATCTRAQSAVFLYRVAGSPAVNGSAGFSDVAADAYYAQAVAWAKEHGITDGIGGGLFGSANDCTRAQIAAFLYRYMK